MRERPLGEGRADERPMRDGFVAGHSDGEAGRTRDHRSHCSSAVARSVFSSRYFTISGVCTDNPSAPAQAPRTARAPGTTTAPSGISSGRSRLGAVHLLAHEVVHRRPPRQHDAGAEDRARAHDGPLVHAAVATDDRIALDDDGRRVYRLQHAADLCGRAQVHAIADLRARADQRVRVDHRSGADVRADVDEHGGHAHGPRRHVRAASNRRAAGHDAHAIAPASARVAGSCACRKTPPATWRPRHRSRQASKRRDRRETRGGFRVSPTARRARSRRFRVRPSERRHARALPAAARPRIRRRQAARRPTAWRPASSIRSASAGKRSCRHAGTAPAAARAALSGALCCSDNGTSGRRRRF